MAVATYATDLTVVDDCEDNTTFSALGGGAAGMNDETDYFLENTQCVSKNGFTAATKGFIKNSGTITVASGDAFFLWAKQNNRNLLDTLANGGMRVVVGDGTSDYDNFYVDGSDLRGGDLAGWRNIAVDPTQTPTNTTGTPTTTDRVGAVWKILGSGSLKGAPQALDVIHHGRELTCIDGQGPFDYANFDAAAVYDSATARRWGLITPTLGGYLQHGAFVMGTASTAVVFIDANRIISVLDDLFVPDGFNEFEIRHASSTVDWTSITINQLAETSFGSVNSPFLLTLDVGVFTGESCSFLGAGDTTFNSNGSSSMINSQWKECLRINLNEADISGSKILESRVATDEGAVYDNRTTTGTTLLSEYDNCVFSLGTNAHHAIRFGTGVDDDITLTGIEFTGFGSTHNNTDTALRFDATSGSLTVNLIGCTVDGSPASSSNFNVDDAAGITVTINFDPTLNKFTVQDVAGVAISGARVLLETAEDVGGAGQDFENAIGLLERSGSVATAVVDIGNHNLNDGDLVVVRGAQPDGYNKIAAITTLGNSTFTYAVDSGLSTPATGSPVYSFVAIHDTSDGSGVVSSSKSWAVSQALKGWARKSTASPFYKQTAITVADATDGTDRPVTLQSDE